MLKKILLLITLLTTASYVLSAKTTIVVKKGIASHKRSPYKLYDDALLKSVQIDGIISDDLKEILSHPKSFFRESHLLVHDEDVAFNHSYVHDMYAYHRWVFNAFEFISRLLVTKRFKK